VTCGKTLDAVVTSRYFRQFLDNDKEFREQGFLRRNKKLFLRFLKPTF